MEDTRCGNKCAFIKAGLCDSDEGCPNYMETVWKTNNGSDIKIVKDCSPKRMMLESQRMVNRCIGLQSSVEQMRNRLDSVESLLNGLTSYSREVLDFVEESKQIEHDK